MQPGWFKALLLALILCGFAGFNQTSFGAAVGDQHHDAVKTADDNHAPHDDPHHAEHDYSAPPLYFDPALFGFTLVLFSLMLIGFRKSLCEPLARNLSAREGRIVQAELDARSARKEIEELTRKAELRLAEVQQQVSGLLAQARKDAEAEKAKITSQAEAEARQIRESALSAIDQARQSAVAELDNLVNDQVALATEHVAGLRF